MSATCPLSMALAGSLIRSTAASSAVVSKSASVVKDATKPLSAKATRAVRGEVNMPSRSIAAVLLRSEKPVQNKVLYEQAKEYGLLRSPRHFKHVLRMMKLQKRVKVMPSAPVRLIGTFV